MNFKRGSVLSIMFFNINYFRLKKLQKFVQHWEDVKRIQKESDLKLIVLHFQGYQSDDAKITAIHRIKDIKWLKKCFNKTIQISSDNYRYIDYALYMRIKFLEGTYTLTSENSLKNIYTQGK